MKTIKGTKYYTMQEIADELGVHYRTAQQYILKGKLKSVKIGKFVLVSEQNLDEFINPPPDREEQ